MKEAEFWAVPVLWGAGTHSRLLSPATKRLSLSAPVGVLAGAAVSSCLTCLVCLSQVCFFGVMTLSSLFLIDSGADDCFIDQNLARKARVTTERLHDPN